METCDEEPPTRPISLEELKLQLYHPPPSQSPVFQENSSNPSPCRSLSFIPWKLIPIVQELSTTVGASSSGEATSSTLLQPPSLSSLSPPFPTEDYLDLRRQQNRAWAENRLTKGNEQYYLDATKADELYQEGLKLCPDHVPLLVAQAKLWIFRRNRPQAAKAQLEHCLRLEPHHADAKDLLERWHRMDASRRGLNAQASSSKGLPQMRESSSAFQNALMERNLAMNSSTILSLEGEEGEEENMNDNDGDDRSNRKKKKKRKSKKKSKHGKKHEKKKKRRKRKRHDSSSDDEDDDDDSISKDDSDRSSLDDASERRQARRRSRRHQRKRRLNRGDSSSDDSTTNICHGMSNRNADDGASTTKHSKDSLLSHPKEPHQGSNGDHDP